MPISSDATVKSTVMLPSVVAHFFTSDLWKEGWKPRHTPLIAWEDTTTLPLDVRRYVLRFAVSGRTFPYASATILGVARWPLDSISLDFYGYTVDSVRVGTSPATFHRDTGTLTVLLPSPLPGGDSVSITVFYHGSPDSTGCPSFTRGFYFRSDGFFTLSYPDGFRCWVPSYDRPYEKADEGVEFYVEADPTLTVLANGVLLDTVSAGSTKVWHYSHTHSIATYLIATAGRVLAANRWVWTYDTLTVPVLSWVPPADTGYGWGDSLTAMLTVFSDRFGPYPFADEKYEQSVVMAYFSGGMEHQTTPFFSSYFDRYVQAHELCHQWWGDAVGYGTFKDVWLGEGFATYCEMLWAEHTGGEAGYRFYYTNTVERQFFTYASNPGKPVYNPGPDIGDILSVYTYNKGAAVLHMLRYVLGKDTALFFGALRYYRSRHEGSYALTGDFVSDVQTFTGRDLGWFFNEWVYQPGWPVYDVRWNAYPDSSGGWTTVLIVEQTQPAGAPTFKMPIEVRWFSGSRDTTFVIWDSLDVQSFTLTWAYPPDSLLWDPDNWILERHTVAHDPSIGVGERVENPERRIRVAVRGREVEVLSPLSSYDVSLYDRAGRLVARGKGKVRVMLLPGIYYVVSRGNVEVVVVR